MTDLKKMRSEFEKKYRLAEVGNKMEEAFGCEFYVFDRFVGNDGARIVARTKDAHIAAKLLKAYPADEMISLNASASEPQGTKFGYYHVTAKRGFRDTYTSMQVQWLHGGDLFEFELPIDGNVLLEPFFYNDKRTMSRSERDTYRPDRNGQLINNMDLPIKRFICEHISYQGGYQSATDTDEIDNIIETIKKA